MYSTINCSTKACIIGHCNISDNINPRNGIKYQGLIASVSQVVYKSPNQSKWQICDIAASKGSTHHLHGGRGHVKHKH